MSTLDESDALRRNLRQHMKGCLKYGPTCYDIITESALACLAVDNTIGLDEAVNLVVTRFQADFANMVSSDPYITYVNGSTMATLPEGHAEIKGMPTHAVVESFGSFPSKAPRDEADQPLPEVNDSQPIQLLVIEDIRKRMEIGKQRYGTYLQAFNGRNVLQDCYEEAMDLCIYLKQAIIEAERK